MFKKVNYKTNKLSKKKKIYNKMKINKMLMLMNRLCPKGIDLAFISKRYK